MTVCGLLVKSPDLLCSGGTWRCFSAGNASSGSTRPASSVCRNPSCLETGTSSPLSEPIFIKTLQIVKDISSILFSTLLTLWFGYSRPPQCLTLWFGCSRITLWLAYSRPLSSVSHAVVSAAPGSTSTCAACVTRAVSTCVGWRCAGWTWSSWRSTTWASARRRSTLSWRRSWASSLLTGSSSSWARSGADPLLYWSITIQQSTVLDHYPPTVYCTRPLPPNSLLY